MHAYFSSPSSPYADISPAYYKARMYLVPPVQYKKKVKEENYETDRLRKSHAKRGAW